MRHLKTIEIDEDTSVQIGQDMISGDLEVHLVWDGDVVRRARAETLPEAESAGRRMAYDFAESARVYG